MHSPLPSGMQADWIRHQTAMRPAQPRPTVAWSEREFDFGQRKSLVGEIRLHCGHCYAMKVDTDRPARPDDVQYLRASVERHLQHAFDTHDCAEHERQEALKRVTERLTRGRR